MRLTQTAVCLSPFCNYFYEYKTMTIFKERLLSNSYTPKVYKMVQENIKTYCLLLEHW